MGALGNHPVDLSIHLKHRGDLPAALAALDRAIRDGVDVARAHYQRALTLVELDRLDDAIAAYHAALAVDPDYGKALVNLAGLYLSRLDSAAATPLLARAEPLVGEDDPIFLVNRAMLHRLNVRVPLAIRDAEIAAERAPDRAGMWVELGLCYLLDPHHLDDAIIASERALELEPRNASAAHALAVALDRRGDAGLALLHATIACAIAPTNLTYAQTKGCILLHLEREPEAVALFETVEAGRPDDFEAQYNLACGLARTGHATRAISHVARAIALVPPPYRRAFLAQVPRDPDLASLRALPAFRTLAAAT